MIARPAHRTAALAVPLAAALLATGCATATRPHAALEPSLRNAGRHLELAKRRSLPSENRIAHSLAAADLAEEALAARRAKPESAIRLNAKATAAATRLLHTLDDGSFWDEPHSFSVPGRTYNLSFAEPKPGAIRSPLAFDTLADAADIRSKHFRRRVTAPGAGAPMVGVRNRSPERLKADPFIPRRGYASAVTATLTFNPTRGNGTDSAQLALRDVSNPQPVRFANRPTPLAADYTAALAYGYPKGNEIIEGLRFMFKPAQLGRRAGLYFLEPYDPKRTPVILVHGLMSVPTMWRDVLNEMAGDPDIRKRFQFWVYAYPTGDPISFNAARFREDLRRATQRLNHRGDLLLVGHSMGGLLSRMQATNPGLAILEEWVGPEEARRLAAELPEEDIVRRSAIFQPNPQVKRIIFICTPHRGSSIATGGIGRLGISLIQLPGTLIHQFTSSAAYAAILIRDAATAGPAKTPRLPTSIQGLSPHSPLLKALDRLPILAPHHSIIGNRGQKGPLEKTSDGVVPYTSAHLDSALSERVVPGNHGAYNLPEAIAELRRILREHR